MDASLPVLAAAPAVAPAIGPAASIAPEELCCVCLETLIQPNRARATSSCNHHFHFDCFATVAANGFTNCPYCRDAAAGLAGLQPVPPLQRAGAQIAALGVARGAPRPRRADFRVLEPLSTVNDALPASDALAETIVPKISWVPGLAGRAETTDVVSGLLRVEVPAFAAVEKASDCVVCVDVSGSMGTSDVAGRPTTKMEFAQASLRALVQGLKPDDRVAILAFDHTVVSLTGLTRGTDEGKALLLRAVDSLFVNGGTSIDPVLAAAASVLEGRTERNPASIVLLLTDGQDSGCRAAACERLTAEGAITFGLGVGFEHDANLLTRITAAGGGTFAYAETSDRIQVALAAAAATAATLVGTGATFEIPGSPPVEVGMLLAGQTTYFPVKGTPGVAKLHYSVRGAAAQAVEVAFDVPVVGEDVLADDETLVLISGHENRVDVATVLKESARLSVEGRWGSAARAAEAIALVLACIERLKASRSAAGALTVALLADLTKEKENLTRNGGRSYDRGASLSAAASHRTQTATGVGGMLYATPSLMASVERVVL